MIELRNLLERIKAYYFIAALLAIILVFSLIFTVFTLRQEEISVFLFMLGPLLAISLAMVVYQITVLNVHRSYMKGIMIDVDPETAYYQFLCGFMKKIKFDEFRLDRKDVLDGRFYYKDVRVWRITVETDTGVFHVRSRHRRKDKSLELADQAARLLTATVEGMGGRTKMV